MFEKISPPAHRAPAATTPKKPRGLISQMIDRFAERRAKRVLRAAARAGEKPVK
jgi:hypothetical protein